VHVCVNITYERLNASIHDPLGRPVADRKERLPCSTESMGSIHL